MESTWRLVLASVLGFLAIALAAGSDFVFGSFWSSHAMLTSLVASLIVLAVTVAVVSEVVDRRARRRWSVLGQYVLFELVQSARATWIGLVELGGLGEVDAHSSAGIESGAQLARDSASLSAAMASALAEPQRRAALGDLVVAVGTHSRALVATWAPLMVDAGPYGPLFDRHVELQSLISWIAEGIRPGGLSDWLASDHEVLVRSSVASEHVTGFTDDWLANQLAAAAQLAVVLDFESTALGFKLVSLDAWRERLVGLGSSLPATEEQPSTIAIPDEL
jgi:hypothetical protein